MACTCMRREGGKVKMMQDPGDKWIVVHGKEILIWNFIWLKDQDIRNERQDQGDKWQMDGEVEDVFWGRNWEKNCEVRIFCQGFEIQVFFTWWSNKRYIYDEAILNNSDTYLLMYLVLTKCQFLHVFILYSQLLMCNDL